MSSNKFILLLLLVSVSIVVACNGNETQKENAAEVKTEMANSAVENTDTNAPADSSEHISNESTTPVNQTNRITRAQQELLARQGSDAPATTDMRYKIDVEPYRHFTDANGYLDLINVDIREVDRVLGVAPIVMKQSREGAPIRREVRVYMPYDEDPTGLYIYFLNDRVESFRMDEFNGITNSSLLDYFN